MKSLFAFLALTTIVLAGAVSCTGDPAAEKPLPEAQQSQQWAIRIYSGPDRKRVDFNSTVTELTRVTRSESPASTSKSLGAKNLNGGGIIRIDPNFIPDLTAPEKDLVVGAALACKLDPQATAIPVWTDAWFVFKSRPRACDQLLLDEQVLLCMADKLAEVADAVDTVIWDFPAGYIPTTVLPPPPWVIPPQADMDRFITRDAAIAVLAHLAQLDGTTVGSDATTCSAQYSHVIADPSWGVQNRNSIFSSSPAITSSDDTFIDSQNQIARRSCESRGAHKTRYVAGRLSVLTS
jgi:hypothetical protein